ncbi:hypothetical protein niasHT_010842 [Heterodera trifolii]|uniref:Uncharacterized protein n=1 Tax=Heterodera trifolii TaxID=157864 RepID=A0ABD2LFA6_9BILA
MKSSYLLVLVFSCLPNTLVAQTCRRTVKGTKFSQSPIKAADGCTGYCYAAYCTKVELSLTQIGQFVFAIRQEFFIQIAEHGTPTEGSNPKEHWTKKFRHEFVNIGKEFGISELINEQKRRISLIRHYIAKKCNEYCENLNFDEKQCREMESQIKARLTFRELIDMAQKLVKHKILKPFFVAEPNFMTKFKMYIWWYRFRYRVDSAVTFEGSARKSEFRLGIVQYYYKVQETFQEQIEKIDNEFAWLKEAIDKLDTIPYNVTVEPHTTDDEQYNVDPFNENERSQGNATPFHRALLATPPLPLGLEFLNLSQKFEKFKCSA